MSWLEAIASSIKYMEKHLTDDITAEQVAQEVNIYQISRNYASTGEIR